MKSILLFTTALSVVFAPFEAAAQTGGFGGGGYSRNLPDRGGRAGITVETAGYDRDGVHFVKVISVEAASPFFDLGAGDFIYAVNGQRFASPEEFIRLVKSYSPGTPVMLTYLDASRGLAAYEQRANLLSMTTTGSGRLDQAYLDQVIAGSRSNPSPPPPPSPRPSYQRNIQAELNRSLDAIVSADSSGWWSNKYLPGSMRDSYIRSSSADGTTYLARGYFSYRGGGGGWVEAKVVNGSLSCIQYWDTWFGCRSPYGGDRTAAQDAAIAAGAITLLAIVAAVASSGGDSGRSSYDDPEGGAGRRSAQQDDPYAKQPVDTSVGCSWGDRKYGTCPQ